MSVKPVAWMVSRETDYESREYFNSAEAAQANACLGVVTTHVTPLYSAPAPELAEALQRVVDCFKVSDSGICHFTMHDPQAFIAECGSLLARITPK